MHYASKYYDPVKAHQYYEEHKELVGRKTSLLNDEGKKIWNHTKQNISSEKNQKKIAASEEYKQKVAALREKAQQQRVEISANLKEKLMSISDESQRRATALSLMTKLDEAKISSTSGSALGRVTTSSGNQIEQARLMMRSATSESQKEALRKKISDIQEDTAEKKSDIREDKASDEKKLEEYKMKEYENIQKEDAAKREDAKIDASRMRETVKTDLSYSISDARSYLNNKKEEINSIYEKIFDSEFNKIAEEYGSSGGSRGKNYDEIYRKAKEARKNKLKG